MFESMVTSIADAGRELLYGGRKPLLQSKSTMLELCHSLLGQKGEALGQVDETLQSAGPNRLFRRS